MSTQFTNRQWRLPNNENKSKQSNYSMNYDSTSQSVVVSSNSAFNFGTGDFTLSAWIKVDSFGSSYYPYILDFRSSSSANENAVAFYLDPNGILQVWISSSLKIGSSGTVLVANTWYNIILKRESGTLSTHINGGSADQTASYAGDMNTTPPLTIGARAGNSQSINGQIDGVAIFDYALSSSQITTLYGSSSTGIGNPISLSPKPVAYYPLGDQDSFNGADYLVPNSSLKDYVFDFDGSNDYIDCGDVPLEGVYTISFWINPDATPSVLYFLFDKRDGSSTNISARVTQSSNNSIRFQIGTTNFSSTDTLTNNSWNNVVLIANGSSSKIYINNGTAANGTLATAPNTTESFFIGTDNAQQSAYFFNGQMSNTQIFNTALPATGSNSVETLYNNGSPLTSMSGFTSLQGWWKLDASATYDGTDWTIPDDSSNSNDGTSSGMTQSALQQSDLSFKTSISPFALSFDGVNDLITISNESNFDFDRTDSFSISCWFKCSDVSANNHIINKLSTSGDYTGFNLFINNTDSKLWFYLRHNYSSPNQIIIKSDNALVNNVWYNLVISYDGSSTAAGCKMYIDNVNVSNTESDTLSSSILNNEPLRIGGRSPVTSSFANGSISNVSIWNAALTSAQISEIYSEGVPQNLNNHSAYSNLVSWWQLGSNTSWVDPYWIALDEKGTNNGESQNVAAPNNMGENAIVDGVGSYANGLSSNMGGDEIIGSAPFSDANSLSVNMDVLDRTTDTPS